MNARQRRKWYRAVARRVEAALPVAIMEDAKRRADAAGGIAPLFPQTDKELLEEHADRLNAEMEDTLEYQVPMWAPEPRTAEEERERGRRKWEELHGYEEGMLDK